jgi:8-oxo-dGTP diphosphatase
VKKTQSHPELEGLGWPTFAEQVVNVPVPVFALGGMKPTDVGKARQNGGQGIAAISGLWPEPI